MDSWEKSSDFYSELILQDIIDKHYAHAEKVFKEYCTDMGDHHDFYVQTDIFLLADVFEKFRDKCIEIYGLDSSCFYSAPGLAWQACLKKTDVKLELLTNYQMLLMIEEEIREGMSQSVHRYANANNKYMKNYNNKIESLYLTYLDVNNLYGWAQKLPVNGFMWYNKYLSDFNEDFVKNYNENSDEGYFLEVDVEYAKKLWSSIKNYHIYQKEKKLKSRKTCL